MRIAVIGTSNSILSGGYTHGIGSYSDTVQLDNLSLGASTSVMLPKVTEENDLGKYDFVILDFAVNEESWVSNNTTSLSHIRDELDDFSSTLGPNTIPVILIMPTIAGLGKVLPVHKFYRDYATKAGYPLIDGFDHVVSLCEEREEQERLFMDRDHLRRDVAFAFGQVIAGTLSQWPLKVMMRHAIHLPIPAHHYRHFAASDIRGGSLLSRETSLASADFARLRFGNSVVLEFPEPEEIVGIGVNLSESNAEIVITSLEGVRRVSVLGKHYKGDNAGMTYVIMPIKPLAGGRFEITLGDSSETAGLQLELAGVSLRGAARLIDVPTFELRS